MKPWINEETIKTWTDAQKRLWESLCSAVPFQPPVGVEAWRETYLKNLMTWELAVKQTLEQEAAWVQQWVQRVAHEKGTPEMMASWVRQMEEVLQRWIQSQNQWWDEYFAVLRRGGLVKLDQAGAEAIPTSEATPPVPKPASAPPAVGSARPEIVVEIAPEPVTSSVAELPAELVVAPVAEPPAAPAVVTSAESPPDDLKLISGIGPALEKKLNACGVFTYQQLAALGDEEIERIEATIKSFGRIRRDDWMGQAREQHLRKPQKSL